MTISHEWSISNMVHKTADGVVITADWQLLSRGGGAVAVSRGEVTFAPPGSDFIPYADLTEDRVIGWVKNELDTNPAYNPTSFYVSNNEKNIEEQLTPKESEGLPWEDQVLPEDLLPEDQAQA